MRGGEGGRRGGGTALGGVVDNLFAVWHLYGGILIVGVRGIQQG